MLLPKKSLFWKLMVLINLYATAVVLVDYDLFPHQQLREVSGITIVSAVMTLLLAFRINAAYDRWWEGRKLWGQLVNDLRNLALKCVNYVNLSDAERKQIAVLLTAFPFALMNHLRAQGPPDRVTTAVPSAATADHVPLHIADLLFKQMAACTTGGAWSACDRLVFDGHVRALMDVCGACERIIKSPLPRTYKQTIWLGLAGYLLILPWVLVPIVGLWSILVMVVASFFVLCVELLAEEVEEPFGEEGNDLPLSSICMTIETSLKQVLG